MNHANQTITLTAIIPAELNGKRLDHAAVRIFPEHSRSRLQQWIKEGRLTVNGVAEKAKKLAYGGERIDINAPIIPVENWAAQDIPLNLVYEDDDILIINKQAGLVVHPAAGNLDNTLLNALLHHAPSLSHLPRAGIIHRLDKNTSGLLIIAKTLIAHTQLVTALQSRSITREYECVVNGSMISGGIVDAPIGRHPRDRLKKAVIEHGKTAVTYYRVMERYRRHTRLQIKLETGRTHQIRVHMSHLRHPLVGDVTYGGRVLLPPQPSSELMAALRQFDRQALHARRLILEHPITKEILSWEADLPEDMQYLIKTLQEDTNETH